MNKPQIRFKGFEEEWQKHTLNDACTSFKYGLNAAACPYDGKHKYLRITDIDDSSRQFMVQNLTSPKVSTISDEFRLKQHDIVFARTGASVGKSYIYNQKDGEVYWAGFLIRASINDLFDSDFVFQNTLTNDYWKYINISSQRSGQPGVNAEQYAEYPFAAPLKSEQVRIGRYLKSVDEMIIEVEREINRLEKMKQASLQKMFPRPGEIAPEIRFTGFSEPWETVKLNSLCSYNSSSLSVGNASKTGKFPLYDANSHVGYTDNAKISEPYISIIKDGAGVGRCRILPKDSFIIGTLGAIIPNKDTDLYYLYKVMKKLRLGQSISGSTIPHIYFSEYGFTELLAPTLEEQKAIGEYFRNLDSLLSAKRQKLVKLRNIKQACLDKMFVNTSEL